MSETEKRDLEAARGFAVQDFFRTDAGMWLRKLLDERIAITVSEMAFAKVKGDDNKREYLCKTFGDFERHRGYAQGLQAALDVVDTVINNAKRRDKEARS
jgi:hypothetical protein